jgi:hypothetical protein
MQLGVEIILWSGGTPAGINGTVVDAANTYTVTVTAANGCSDTESIIITQDVQTIAAAINNNTGSTEINCTVNSISVTASGGNLYQWSGGNSPNTANNTFTSSGNYTVTVTNTLNGCSDTETITIDSKCGNRHCRDHQ